MNSYKQLVIYILLFLLLLSCVPILDGNFLFVHTENRIEIRKTEFLSDIARNTDIKDMESKLLEQYADKNAYTTKVYFKFEKYSEKTLNAVEYVSITNIYRKLRTLRLNRNADTNLGFSSTNDGIGGRHIESVALFLYLLHLIILLFITKWKEWVYVVYGVFSYAVVIYSVELYLFSVFFTLW